MKWTELINKLDLPNELINDLEAKVNEVKSKTVEIDVEVKKIGRLMSLLSVPPQEFDCFVESMNKLTKLSEELRQ